MCAQITATTNPQKRKPLGPRSLHLELRGLWVWNDVANERAPEVLVERESCVSVSERDRGRAEGGGPGRKRKNRRKNKATAWLVSGYSFKTETKAALKASWLLLELFQALSQRSAHLLPRDAHLPA